MEDQHSHPSDEELLLELEGELSASASKRVRNHLTACWECRCRSHEFETTITEFSRFHTREHQEQLPPSAGPRALLRARLRELPMSESTGPLRWLQGFRRHTLPVVATGCGIFAIIFWAGLFLRRPANAAVVSVPNGRLTPGATLLADRRTVCGLENVKNKAVPSALQKKVFEEYGIRGAEPRLYEVDYLVTPALGGADDIRNLWPHSYSADWNAKVKDQLEDRLRSMVCEGTVELDEAQREIAVNWIAAYKKYFHTDKPLRIR